LLFESGFNTLCDLNVAIWCPPRIQLARLMKRDGSSRTEALARIGAQAPLKAKCRQADLVIDNSGTRAELAREFARILQTIRSLSCR
ncbi:MAG: dephospho-CoA kinase, partial [bacterium]